MREFKEIEKTVDGKGTSMERETYKHPAFERIIL